MLTEFVRYGMRFKTGYWKRGAVKAQARTLEDKTVTEYEHEDL